MQNSHHIASPDKPSLIIAGASGLVGSDCLNLAIKEDNIGCIYALVRKPLPEQSTKIIPIIDAQLNIKQWDESLPAPTLGIIALGTTLKQAGSKQGLEDVDYHLVCHVAQQMKMLGVERLVVVSSIGAHPRSKSHYLRCKGRMEESIRQFGFTQVTFVRPGPLAGQRKVSRKDEVLLQKLMRVGKYLLFGQLKNFIPIHSKDVALSMLYSLFTPETKPVRVLDSIKMRSILDKYN